MSNDLDMMAFTTAEELWSWLEQQPATHPGNWVRLQKVGTDQASIDFHDLLEAGIAFGWSESNRRAYDATSYLQKSRHAGPQERPPSATASSPIDSRRKAA